LGGLSPGRAARGETLRSLTTTTTALPFDCDDALRCTDDTCDPFTGVCNHVFDPAN